MRPSQGIILHIYTKRVKVKNVIIQPKISSIKIKTIAQSKKRLIGSKQGKLKGYSTNGGPKLYKYKIKLLFLRGVMSFLLLSRNTTEISRRHPLKAISGNDVSMCFMMNTLSGEAT